MKRLTVGIIGCGNMGGAIARGIAGRGAINGDILLSDKDTEKAVSLAAETGGRRENLSTLVRGSDILVIAVKPQDSENLFSDISGYITGQTIVSVMAGVRISAITGKLGKEIPVARAMPNMAASVSESITCITHNSMVKDTEEIRNIFTGIGRVLEVEEEALDSITALSGSGPAYLFYLAGAMIEAGEEMGLDQQLTKELVVQTLYGSAVLMRRKKLSPQELVRGVASKGGTTEAALSIFERRGLKSIIKAAIAGAKDRSEKLSRE